jgi:hypothetical protein
MFTALYLLLRKMQSLFVLLVAIRMATPLHDGPCMLDHSVAADTWLSTGSRARDSSTRHFTAMSQPPRTSPPCCMRASVSPMPTSRHGRSGSPNSCRHTAPARGRHPCRTPPEAGLDRARLWGYATRALLGPHWPTVQTAMALAGGATVKKGWDASAQVLAAGKAQR